MFSTRVFNTLSTLVLTFPRVVFVFSTQSLYLPHPNVIFQYERFCDLIFSCGVSCIHFQFLVVIIN